MLKSIPTKNEEVFYKETLETIQLQCELLFLFVIIHAFSIRSELAVIRY